MEGNPKRLLDKFQGQLKYSWDEYRERHGLEDSRDALITYLIDFQLIKQSTIRKFTIQKEFKNLYSLRDMNKTEIVKKLSDKYNLSSRSIWNLIKE